MSTAGGVSAVFLDRDGTLNVKADEGDYVLRPDDLRLLPGAAAAVRRLNEAGIATYVVSNQRCVALGLLDPAGLEAVMQRLRDLLAAEGARVDGIYSCPHDVGACDCRKPLPGLLLRAAAEHPGVALDRSVLIGDAESDVAAAHAAGAGAVRLAAPGAPTAAEAAVADLEAAVTWVLTSRD